MDTKSSTLLGAFLGMAGATGVVLTDIGTAGGLLTAFGGGASPAEGEYCLLTDAPFFGSLKTGCYTKSDIENLYKSDLVNARGQTVSVRLSSPPEAADDSVTCQSCADYERMQQQGWFAISTRDQRREAFFARACLFLTYLREAEMPTSSHFDGRQLTQSDISTLEPRGLFQMTGVAGAAAAGEDRDSDAGFSVSRYRPLAGSWQVDLTDQQVVIQPLLHADFDDDGVGDILAFVRPQYESGTANHGTIGFFKKVNEDGPVTFRMLDAGPLTP